MSKTKNHLANITVVFFSIILLSSSFVSLIPSFADTTGLFFPNSASFFHPGGSDIGSYTDVVSVNGVCGESANLALNNDVNNIVMKFDSTSIPSTATNVSINMTSVLSVQDISNTKIVLEYSNGTDLFVPETTGALVSSTACASERVTKTKIVSYAGSSPDTDLDGLQIRIFSNGNDDAQVDYTALEILYDLVSPTGTLTIEKVAIGANGTFQFTNDTGVFYINTEIANTTSITVEPGTYNITETSLPTNWRLIDIQCDDDSNKNIEDKYVNASVSSGEDLTCTFYNVKNGTLTINKEVVPVDFDGYFDFELDSSYLTTLSDGAGYGPISIFNNTQYNVTEIINPNYTTIVNCGDGDNASNTALVTPEPGEDIECTFTNTIKNATLTIIKETDPEGDDTTFFDFEGNSTDIGSFQLKGLAPNNSTEPFSLYPGAYNVTENLTGPWELLDIDCGDDATYINDYPNNRTTISLDPEEDVTCTFTNNKLISTLNVTKYATEYSDTFEFFNGTLFDLIVPADGSNSVKYEVEVGSHNVTEIVPYGWKLVNIFCDDNLVDTNSTTAFLDISVDNDVNCEFYNEPSTDLAITKNATAYAHEGDIVSYYINVTNNGPHRAHDVSVYDFIDQNTTYDDSDPLFYSFNDPIGIWNVPSDLEVNDSIGFQLNVTVSSSQPGYLNNTALVNSTTHEINYENNTASAFTAVLPKLLVTNGADINGFDFNSTSIDMRDFRIIYTPDPLDVSNFTLSSTTPGVFFAHIFYIDEPNTPASMNVTIPGPFVSKGTNWLHTYGDVEIDGDGFVPVNDIPFTSNVTSITGLNGAVVHVNGTTSDNGLFYAIMHLEFGLKKTPNYTNVMNNATNTNSDYSIDDHTEFQFGVDADADENDSTDSIYNLNVFKNPRGVLGHTDDPLNSYEVYLINEDTLEEIGPVLTDEDDFAFIDYMHKGKATTFHLESDGCDPSDSFTLGGKYKYQYAELENCYTAP